MTENVWSRLNRFFVSIASIAVYMEKWCHCRVSRVRPHPNRPFSRAESGKVPIIISVGLAMTAAVNRFTHIKMPVTHNGFGILMVRYLMLLISNLLWDVRPKLKRLVLRKPRS
jgi:hypothetical protein